MNELQVEGVAKSFGKRNIIENLSFSLGKEEFVSIIGPSGSGKSTLFNLIGGIYKPDAGTIRLGNEVINGKRGMISYMPQTPSLLPWRNVLDNVLLGQELMGERDVAAACMMLERAGLQEYAASFSHELSGGMQQRVAFIRALLSPQSIICLDEPFSALDELTRVDMQKWLLSIWEMHKRSVLFVTHNIEEAMFLSDRILVLSAKPAQIIAEFKLPFARPRAANLLLDDQFIEWKRKIYSALKSG